MELREVIDAAQTAHARVCVRVRGIEQRCGDDGGCEIGFIAGLGVLYAVE